VKSEINRIINESVTFIKKIGIIGSGIAGKTLANGFIKHGYDVMIGTRDPVKLAE